MHENFGNQNISLDKKCWTRIKAKIYELKIWLNLFRQEIGLLERYHLFQGRSLVRNTYSTFQLNLLLIKKTMEIKVKKNVSFNLGNPKASKPFHTN